MSPESAFTPSAAVLIAFSLLFITYEAMWVGGALTHSWEVNQKERGRGVHSPLSFPVSMIAMKRTVRTVRERAVM